MYPPNEYTFRQLEFVITFTGSAGSITVRATGTTSVSVSVEPGQWEILVRAYMRGTLYSEGRTTVDVKPGVKNSTSVQMEMEDEVGSRINLELNAPPEATPELVEILKNANYTITFTGPEGTEPEILEVKGNAPIMFLAAPGTWRIDAAAAIGGTLSVQGTASTTIEKGQSVNLALALTLIDSGSPNGKLKINNLPPLTGIRVAHVFPDNAGIETYAHAETMDLGLREAAGSLLPGAVDTVFNLIHAVGVGVYNGQGAKTVILEDAAGSIYNPAVPRFRKVIVEFGEGGSAEVQITDFVSLVLPCGISFETYEGSGIPALSGLDYGVTIAKPDDPTLAETEFGGWYKDSAFTDDWDFATDTVTGEITLYAKWIGRYTIAFESKGGSPTGTKTAQAGTKIDKPADPFREGAQFDGWYKEEQLEYKWNFDVDTVNSNITLYAKWLSLQTVTFSSNGGNEIPPIPNAVSSKAIAKPQPDPVRNGFDFIGWFKDSALTDDWNFDYDTVAGNMTLYAKWVYADGLPIASVEMIRPYLESQGEGSPDAPIYLPIKTGPDTDIQNGLSETVWFEILKAIAEAGKYVDLDLTECTRSTATSGGGLRQDGTFDPTVPTTSTQPGEYVISGKAKVISIILPATAYRTADEPRYTTTAVFRNFTSLREFNTGDGLEIIGTNILFGLATVNEINLGSKVRVIGENAFQRTGLTGITIPEGVTTIDASAFRGCRLTEVIIPDSVISLGANVFTANTPGLTAVHIGKGISSIGEYAFATNKLTNVTIPNNITSIGNYAFQTNQIGNVTIPNSVTTIGNYAFHNNQIKNIIIPDSVTIIGTNAFQTNQISELILGERVSSIGNYAFDDNNLTSLVIPNSVTTIGNDVFRNNLLSNVTIGSGLAVISAGTFNTNQLTQIDIPDTVTSIESFAFRDNLLINVTIPDTVLSIGNFAFSDNELTDVTLPFGLTTLSTGVFSKNNLTSIEIPLSVTKIQSQAFSENKLSGHIEIPASVISIENLAFFVNQIASISLGADNLSLGDRAFHYNDNINKVTIRNNVTCDSTLSIPNGFVNFYNNNDKLAGTYEYNSVSREWL